MNCLRPSPRRASLRWTLSIEAQREGSDIGILCSLLTWLASASRYSTPKASSTTEMFTSQPS